MLACLEPSPLRSNVKVEKLSSGLQFEGTEVGIPNFSEGSEGGIQGR